MITTLLAFLVTLGVLIVVHEYGHYRVARWCGVKVLRFSVGFGKTIWRRQRSPEATEFVVAALPLGGYVKMLDGREGPVAAEESSQAFDRQSLAKRSAIVAAGPLANLLLAALLYAAAQWIGVEEPQAVLGAPLADSMAERADLRAGDWVREASDDGVQWRPVVSYRDLVWQTSQAALDSRALQLRVSDRAGVGLRVLRLDFDRQHTSAMDEAAWRRIGLGGVFRQARLGSVKPDGAAAQAGLRAGDVVLRVDGKPMPDAQTLLRVIREGADRKAVWSIDRDGQPLDLEVQPRAVIEGGKSFGRIGAELGGPPAMVLVRDGFLGGLAQGFTRTWDMSVATLRMLARMFVDVASIKNLSGPLTIADAAGQSVHMGLVPFLEFLAVVSVGLGVLNLLPIPILDGGHLMYHLFEALTRRPLSDAWLQRLQRGGVFVLLLLMTVAFTNDLIRQFGP